MGYVIERKKKIGKKWFGPISGKIYMPLWWWVCFGFLHDCEDKRVPGVNCGQAWLLGLVTCTRVTSISVPLVLVLCHLVLKSGRLFGVASFWGIPATGPCNAPALFLPLRLNLEYGSCLQSGSSFTGVRAELPEERPTGNKLKLSLHRIFHHLRFLQGKEKEVGGEIPSAVEADYTSHVLCSTLSPSILFTHLGLSLLEKSGLLRWGKRRQETLSTWATPTIPESQVRVVFYRTR